MAAYLLDTSALLVLRYDEEGADEVEALLHRRRGGESECLVSFMTFMEYFYSVWRGEGKATALKAYLQMKMLPLKRIDLTESLLLLAAELKATYPLSLADSWIAATAIESRTILVHKDPEFEQLAGRVELKALPYRTR